MQRSTAQEGGSSIPAVTRKQVKTCVEVNYLTQLLKDVDTRVWLQGKWLSPAFWDDKSSGLEVGSQISNNLSLEVPRRLLYENHVHLLTLDSFWLIRKGRFLQNQFQGLELS